MRGPLVACKNLARFFGALSHPDRVRIVEELRKEEKDVATLQGLLGVSHARVSQHLAVLRSQHLVGERRQGRRVFYRLLDPRLAAWVLAGLSFLEVQFSEAQMQHRAAEEVRLMWAGEEEKTDRKRTPKDEKR